MAITKNQISEFFRTILSGGDATLEGKLHPTIIWMAADTVLGGLVQEAMRKDQKSNGYDINGSFLSTFTIDVLNNTSRGEKYSVLPYSVISLRDNRGLHRVSAIGSPEFSFTQVSNGSHDIFRILDAHYLNTHTEFYQEGNKLFYRNIGKAIDKVLVKAVFSITGLGGDEPIAIPSSEEDEFLDRIQQRLMPQVVSPQDKTNDSNPNTLQQ